MEEYMSAFQYVYIFYFNQSSAGYISSPHKERYPKIGIFNYHVWMPQQSIKTSHKKHGILQSSNYGNREVLQVQPPASKKQMQ